MSHRRSKTSSFRNHPRDLEEIRLQKKLERLFFRVMQLNKIRHEGIDIETDMGKAEDLREEIREIQEALNQIYEKIGENEEADDRLPSWFSLEQGDAGHSDSSRE